MRSIVSFCSCCGDHRDIHFPYTTLFRSAAREAEGEAHLRRAGGSVPPLLRGGRADPRHHRRHAAAAARAAARQRDRKSTRLNSSHVENSYAVFCLKKKT